MMVAMVDAPTQMMPRQARCSAMNGMTLSQATRCAPVPRSSAADESTQLRRLRRACAQRTGTAGGTHFPASDSRTLIAPPDHCGTYVTAMKSDARPCEISVEVL